MPIVNLEAWENGRHRAIISNAQKTFFATVEDANDILDWVHYNSENNDFALSLSNAFDKFGKLTEGQCNAVRKCIARAEENRAKWQAKNEQERANAEDVPEGRIQITGVIVSTKFYDNDWGTQLKCVIKDDRGFNLFGSIPSSVEDYACSEEIDLKGLRVTLTATVIQSDDDTKFGFFKRPSKALII